MTTITIPLSDERAAQQRLWAEEVGLPPEEFLRRRVEQLFDRPDEQFQTRREEFAGWVRSRMIPGSAEPGVGAGSL